MDIYNNINSGNRENEEIKEEFIRIKGKNRTNKRVWKYKWYWR